MAKSRKSRIKERKQQEQKSQQSKQIMVGGAVAIIVLVLAAFFASRASSVPGADLDLDAIPDNSVTYDDLGRDHINTTDPHDDYNSNPPTSGPHSFDDAETGVYTRALPDELLIHNLEHGHIWLSYRDLDDQEVVDFFTEIQSSFPSSVIVTYRPDNDSRIAAAAWRQLLKLEELDEDQILAFIQRYRDQAPESVPG